MVPEVFEEFEEEFPTKNKRASVRRKNTIRVKRKEGRIEHIESLRRFDENKLKTALNKAKKKAEKRHERQTCRNLDVEI